MTGNISVALMMRSTSKQEVSQYLPSSMAYSSQLPSMSLCAWVLLNLLSLFLTFLPRVVISSSVSHWVCRQLLPLYLMRYSSSSVLSLFLLHKICAISILKILNSSSSSLPASQSSQSFPKISCGLSSGSSSPRCIDMISSGNLLVLPRVRRRSCGCLGSPWVGLQFLGDEGGAGGRRRQELSAVCAWQNEGEMGCASFGDGCRLQQMHSLKGGVPVPVVGPELGPRDLVHIIVILGCLLVQRILALRHSLPSNNISNIIKNNPPHNYSALPLRSLFPSTPPTAIHFPSPRPSAPCRPLKKNQSARLRCHCLLPTPAPRIPFPPAFSPALQTLLQILKLAAKIQSWPAKEAIALEKRSSLQQGRREGSWRRATLGFYLQYLNQLKSIQQGSFDFMLPALHHPDRQTTRIGNAVTSTIKYELKDDPFIVPIKFKRELPINKNFFELQEIQPKNYHQNDERVEMSEMTMLDPLLMSIATIKFLLLEKIVSYTSLFSIGLSVYQVYYVAEEEIVNSLTLFHTAITVLLLICVLISAGFHYQNNKSRMMGQKYMFLRTAFKIILILISPNPWWGGNSLLLHLALLGRLFFPLALYIRSTLYYSPRAARIIHLYGIKPEMTFEFAWKVVLNNMDIMQVIFIYIAVVVLFSHSLFLASEDIPFNDCFEIVIVTLPTVGFGEYIVQDSVPRVVIIVILMTGVGLNAFVTLILLKKFEMTTNQNNSYILMEKLNMISQIQQLSSQFIIRKFQKKRARSAPLEKEKDQDFKQRYKQCKARYRKMNPQDSAYQFNFFKNSLLNLKIKIYQVNNMINVLLARLIHFRRERKNYFKHMKDK